MRDLPDINVWLALADGQHPHHGVAQAYWKGEAAPVVGFTRVTMMGFLRLSTRPGVLSRPLVPDEAWAIYRAYLARDGIRLLPDAPGLDSEYERLALDSGFLHRLWTDAYLAAFAISGACRVVSFDGDFARFEGLSFLHLQPNARA
ncbi:MAG: PIN domain-containing protein [Verrucomicrobiaceae bacterium]|nr:PIN domain-containing protein [Verrucomicrobiaceae bacterium]